MRMSKSSRRAVTRPCRRNRRRHQTARPAGSASTWSMDARRRGHRSQLGSPRLPDGRCQVLNVAASISAASRISGSSIPVGGRKRRCHQRASRCAAACGRASRRRIRSAVIPTRASQHGHSRRAFGGLCPPKDSRPLWHDPLREHLGKVLRSVGGRLSRVRTLN